MRIMQIFQRNFLRRASLLAIGLTLGALYHHRFLTDYYLEPFLLALIVGFFSITLFRAFINNLIVLIGMILAILVMALAANMGAGAPFVIDTYLEIIAAALVRSAVALLVWIPGLPAGFYLRKVTLERMSLKNSRQNSRHQ